MITRCIGKRPGGRTCERELPPGNKAFCERCSGENFKSKPKFKDADLPEFDKPNAYEPEPVEIRINEFNPIPGSDRD